MKTATKDFDRKKSVVVLCIGERVTVSIENYCMNNNIECHYLNINKDMEELPRGNWILFGKPFYYKKFDGCTDDINWYGNYIVAESIADESRNDFKELLETVRKEYNCEHIILIAGLGCFIASAFAPVIAQCINQLNLNAYSIMSMPYPFVNTEQGHRAFKSSNQVKIALKTKNILFNEYDDAVKNKPEIRKRFKQDPLKTSEELFIENLKYSLAKINS